ncbi:hypothetical protein ACT3TI_09265 [Psychrobacter sp. AOP22-C1-22]|uniref:hypothetical protein n=1 Tax=unclassified Psychrobacter TaxID=196806 RepID=UPI0017888BDE|nr:hypothetical protein [Psychrobacter sp. FME6]MBE0445371.1 hypothetical protein [Psychrobacter sp. FME5]
MKPILKHSFEAVSLLTTNNGMLDVTIVPAFNQPDWIIPSSLVLSVDDYHERTSSYDWQQQEVAVFHLLPEEQAPDKMIVLEGNTLEHRFALQTMGELRHLQARISEVKDIEVPEQLNNYQTLNDHEQLESINIDETEGRFSENDVLSYLFQTVMIDEKPYLVPDLDKIAHQLVDLDS